MNITKINIEDYTFNMVTDDDLVVQSLENGRWEHKTLRIWAEKVKQTSGMIMDVGAYTGIYALLASAVDSERTVIALEPLHQVFYRLDKNIAINPEFKNAHAEKAALSDESGITNISITNPIHLPSGSSLNPIKKIHHEVEIKKYEGDNVVEDAEVGLIKIDTEHHEEHVLRGLEKTLKRCNPVCIIEILDMGMLHRIICFMEDLGYNSIMHINDANGVMTSLSKNSKLIKENFKGGMNYIFEKV